VYRSCSVQVNPCRRRQRALRSPASSGAGGLAGRGASRRSSAGPWPGPRPISRRCSTASGRRPTGPRSLIVHDHAAAEDIAQEAFLAAIRRLDRFDRRRRFGPWLGAIVANRAIDWARARTARRETSDEGADPASQPEVPLGRYSQEVLTALASLSPEHRAVIVLRHLLEYSPGEIARALELPRGTVNSRLRRGLDTLETRLREMER
jgi:RNA polymerase sigma-70 factor, ECF subfamily